MTITETNERTYCPIKDGPCKGTECMLHLNDDGIILCAITSLAADFNTYLQIIRGE